MRGFVLCTGRSGSTTFAKACQAGITNYTSGHETQPRRIDGRLTYPDQHVEVDHRLSWFLGSLDRIYGDEPVFVHLTRDLEKTAESWAVRMNQGGQMPTWLDVVLYRPGQRNREVSLPAARLMVRTVTDSILLFLRDKTKVVTVDIDDPHEAFDDFYDLLGAEGDRAAAHRTLAQVHNRRKVLR